MSDNTTTTTATTIDTKALLTRINELEQAATNKAYSTSTKEVSISIGTIATGIYALSFIIAALAVFNIINLGPIISVPTFGVLFLGSLFTYITSSDTSK